MIQDDGVLGAVHRLETQLQRLRVVFADRHGLSQNDGLALTTLALSPDPMTPTQLAGAMGMTGATVTAVLNRLEDAGFVRRERDSRDRRSVQIALQPSSRAAVAELQGLLSRAVGTAMDEDERSRVADSLHRLGTAFEHAIGGFGGAG